MRALFESEYRGERDAALAVAARVLERRLDFFGQTFELGSPVAWNRDPVSGAEWPRRYHRDVPIHGGNRDFGDVKFVWEVNRHQFLIDLGRASFLTGSSEYAAAARALVTEWIADNPYATGVNWACAMEPAFRVLSWLWTYYLCLDQEASHPEHHLSWLTSFYDHGRFLYRHLEYYSSPFNHLIGEAAALYMLGVLFPEFTDAPAWRKRGRRVLESRLEGQFYADGGTLEQSTFYHHATLGFYMLAVVLGARNSENFSAAVRTAVERGMAFSMALLQPNSKVPSIGGADDGKPLRMEHLPLWDFRPYQAIGAVMFGRGDFKYVAGRFHEDALWLLGPEGLTAFNELPATPPAWKSVLLRDSGYAVLRIDWSSTADYVCVDCGDQAGELRTDAVPNSVHGHADALSVIVSLRGRPVLVDSGLFCYNGDPKWEAHFRRTGAHNTARIDGADQALHLGKMAWSYSYRVTQEHWMATADQAAIIASHDGYTRCGGDTIHRRLVWLRPGGYVIVYDEFECRREHDLELNFQFAPGDLHIVYPWLATFNNDVEVGWAGSGELRADLHCGGPEPDQGWVAPSLGVLVAAPRLTLSGRVGAAPSAALTVFAAHVSAEDAQPGAAASSRIAVLSSQERRGANSLIRVTGPDFTDYIGAPSIARHDLLGATDAPVAIWRFREDRNVDAVQMGGTYVREALGVPR